MDFDGMLRIFFVMRVLYTSLIRKLRTVKNGENKQQCKCSFSN